MNDQLLQLINLMSYNETYVEAAVIVKDEKRQRVPVDMVILTKEKNSLSRSLKVQHEAETVYLLTIEKFRESELKK